MLIYGLACLLEVFKFDTAQQLVELMLKYDPAQRITAAEILLHPWIKGEDVDGYSESNRNVISLMRSYNAERRLRKIFLFVLAAVRFAYVKSVKRKNSLTGITTGLIRSNSTSRKIIIDKADQKTNVSLPSKDSAKKDESSKILKKSPSLVEEGNVSILKKSPSMKLQVEPLRKSQSIKTINPNEPKTPKTPTPEKTRRSTTNLPPSPIMSPRKKSIREEREDTIPNVLDKTSLLDISDNSAGINRSLSSSNFSIKAPIKRMSSLTTKEIKPVVAKTLTPAEVKKQNTLSLERRTSIGNIERRSSIKHIVGSWNESVLGE